MKIIDIINSGKPSLSFEVFPPKTNDVYDSVKHATQEIAKLSPSFMSVTYGAGGGTSEYTLKIAESIKKEYSVASLAHLTCISSTKQTVRAMLEKFKSCSIENVMALRGDIPDDRKNEDRSNWDYRYATDLICDIKSYAPELCIGAACYPEVHPESKTQEDDIYYLKKKVDEGCDFLTTQMFFDNGIFYSFLEKIRQAGISVPVVAGIMPVTSVTQIDRVVKLSGSFLPEKFLKLVDEFGDDPEKMKQAGLNFASEQIKDLYANGISAVHVYSMNKPDVAMQIKNSLSEIIK